MALLILYISIFFIKILVRSQIVYVFSPPVVVVVTLITAVLSVLLHNQVPPAMMGLAIAYSASISGIFQFAIRMMAEAETRFISVERINSYVSVSYNTL